MLYNRNGFKYFISINFTEDREHESNKKTASTLNHIGSDFD